MAENKTQWLIGIQKTLLVFHNQLVGFFIPGRPSGCIQLFNNPAFLFVRRKIAVMHGVRRMRYQSLIHGHLADFGVKFLEPHGKLSLLPVAAVVIRAVAFDVVNEKEREDFYTFVFQPFLFCKVLFDGLAELAFQSLIIHAARFLRQLHHHAVLKFDIFIPRFCVDIGDQIALIIRPVGLLCKIGSMPYFDLFFTRAVGRILKNGYFCLRGFCRFRPVAHRVQPHHSLVKILPAPGVHNFDLFYNPHIISADRVKLV